MYEQMQLKRFKIDRIRKIDWLEKKTFRKNITERNIERRVFTSFFPCHFFIPILTFLTFSIDHFFTFSYSIYLPLPYTSDSVFVHLKGKTKADAFRIGKEIAEKITQMSPRDVVLKFEKVYLPCVLISKKRWEKWCDVIARIDLFCCLCCFCCYLSCYFLLYLLFLSFAFFCLTHLLLLSSSFASPP